MKRKRSISLLTDAIVHLADATDSAGNKEQQCAEDAVTQAVDSINEWRDGLKKPKKRPRQIRSERDYAEEACDLMRRWNAVDREDECKMNTLLMEVREDDLAITEYIMDLAAKEFRRNRG